MSRPRELQIKAGLIVAAITAPLLITTVLPCEYLTGVLPGALAANGQNKMPPMAPPIRRPGAPSQPVGAQAVETQELQPQNAATDGTASAATSAATFKRRPTTTVTPNFSQPLSGNVDRVGNGAPLNGNVDRMGGAPLMGNVNRAGALHGNADYMVPVPPGMSMQPNADVPAATFRAWLQKAHPDFSLTASRLSENDVVEVKGAWDDSGKTLRKLGIPSSRIRGGALRDYPLDRVKVLIINCSGDVPKESYQRIRDFVSHGGYLLSTDWSLDHMLTKAFPGYVAWNRKENKKLTYDAEVTNPDPVLFQYTVRSAMWKMDRECHMVSVTKPESVRVLARSRGLASEDGDGILAFVFPFGRGRVLHLVGHFDNDPNALHFGDSLPDPAPVIGISLRQAIAANFVVSALQGTRIPE